MKFKIVLPSEIDRVKWQEYVDSHEDGTVFHSPFFNALYKSFPLYEPFALFALDPENNIQAMLQGYIQTVKPGLMSFLSRRAVLLKAPIYSDLDALRELLEFYVHSVGPRVVYTEIRNQINDLDSKSVYQGLKFEFEEHLNFIVDCTTHDATWKSISESRRRQIKKGLANGAQIINDPHAEQVGEFYGLLKILYAEKVKKPLPPYSYFKALYDSSLLNPDKIKYLLIEYGGKIIGGICCFISGQKAIHELYVAGLDNLYKDIYPSSLATWSAIEYAISKQIAAFDFMGAGKPEEDYGVRDFKARFGGTLIEAGRYHYFHAPLKMKIAESGFRLLQKLKLNI